MEAWQKSYACSMRPSIKEPPTERGLAETLTQRQRRAKEFLGEIRSRTNAARAGLLAQLERILESIESEKADCRKTKQELLEKTEELRRQMEIVGRFRDDFARWQEQREAVCRRSLEQQTAFCERIEKQQGILDEKLAGLKEFQAELDKREEELRRVQRETSLARQDFDAQQQYLEEKRIRLNDRLAELEVEREELAVAQKKLDERRRELDAVVKARKGGLDASGASSLSEEEHSGVSEEAYFELESRRRRLEEELGEVKGELSRQSEELDDLVREKIELIQRLDAAEKYAGEGGGGEGDFEAERDELRGEIERLQGENEELRREVESFKSRPAEPGGGTVHGAAVVAATDWESQKAQILAALEKEGEDVTSPRTEDRVKISEVLGRTDAVIAEKDREIRELTALLQERTENMGTVAVGAAAVGDLLDKDEIIVQERSRLEELKKEWEAKLRQAEVEISLERAALAREKQILAEAVAKHPEVKSHGHGEGKGSETSRKKWMSALGLSDENNEQGG